MAHLRKLLASLLLSSSAAMAQGAAVDPLGPDAEVILELDAARAHRVNAILHRARERLASARDQIGEPIDGATYWILVAAVEAIAADADQQLSQVLTPRELEIWHAAVPQPARPHHWINA